MQIAGRAHRGLLLSSEKTLAAFVGVYGGVVIRPDGTTFNMLFPYSYGTVNGKGVCFSPDNSHVCMTYSSYNVPGYQATIHNVADGTIDRHLPIFSTGEAYTPTYSPDGQYLAFSCYTGTPSIVVFKTSDWTAVTLPELPGLCNMVRWAPDSSALLCATTTAPHLWIYEAGPTWTRRAVSFGVGEQPPTAVSSLAINPAGNRIVLGAPNSGQKWAVYTYPSLSMQPGFTPSPPHPFNNSATDMAISADGSLLIIACEVSDNFFMYSMTTGEKIALDASLKKPVSAVAFAKKGKSFGAVFPSDLPVSRVYNAALGLKNIPDITHARYVALG